MTETSATHYRWSELPKEALNPLLGRRLIATERMMLAHVYLEQGCVVPKHAHENEQLTYILEGVLRFWLGEDESQGRNAALLARLHRHDEVLLDPVGQFHCVDDTTVGG